MQQQIESDLKAALLAGDRQTVETLKTIKNALLYEAVNKSTDRAKMSDDQVRLVLSREAKKRQEAADMYAEAGELQRSQNELSEKSIIEKYLPEQMSEAEIAKLIESEVSDDMTVKDMGRIIGAVKAKAGASADGSIIAKLVKEKLSE